jgi:hypothetical protein
MDDVSLNGEQYTVSSIANNLLNSGQVTDEPPCTEMGLGTVKQVKSLIKMTTGSLQEDQRKKKKKKKRTGSRDADQCINS